MRFLLLLLMLISPCVEANQEDCATDKLFDGKLFELELSWGRYGIYKAVYKFCYSEQSHLFYELYEPVAIDSISETFMKYSKSAILPDSLANKIKTQYELAVLRLNNDTVIGFHGSKWCFKPKSGLNYGQYCYWTPTYNSKQRGLDHLVELKKLVSNIFEE
ncbi:MULTISPECIES: hypothetical protein [Pseudoalteromonas]|uniref:hypothetical protein n=1 Tax=Pseudoalteromonas TaxID=53246 RepID=UPI001112791C|nr:hypothetical protein [Pseudoalteromonas piscicida]